MKTVRIPTPLRAYSKGRDQLSLDGSTVRELLDNLVLECQGLDQHIYDNAGNTRRFVNIFLNEEDVKGLDGLATKVEEGDVVSIIPAIAGGM